MHTLSILVVDDDPDIRTIVALTLGSQAGWMVQEAASGAEAIELASRDKPDLVVMDVMMPGMDGPTAALHLREIPELASVPIIFLTAAALASQLSALESFGAFDVLTKPFNPHTLPDQVRSLLTRKQT